MNIGHATALELLQSRCSPGRLVVDAGAFPGTLTRQLKKRGWNVIALDKEPNRETNLQYRFLSEGNSNGAPTFAQLMAEIGVEVRAVDLEDSPYPIESATVDAVILTEVIEHLWVDPLFALTEMNRVLLPGGILLISTPNLLSIRNRFNFLRGRMGRVIEHPFLAFLKKSRLGHIGHVRLYAADELATMLSLLGFEPQFHFYSFDYWDPGPPDDDEKGEVSESKANAVRQPLIGKLIRSPRSYLSAGIATLRGVLEKFVPPFRPHLFIVATKMRDADYRTLSMAEVCAQIGES